MAPWYLSRSLIIGPLPPHRLHHLAQKPPAAHPIRLRRRLPQLGGDRHGQPAYQLRPCRARGRGAPAARGRSARPTPSAGVAAQSAARPPPPAHDSRARSAKPARACDGSSGAAGLLDKAGSRVGDRPKSVLVPESVVPVPRSANRTPRRCLITSVPAA